jgi:antitoxin (DNA-binding transcriptional repressor) of toxin-antitoxin stability system
VGRPKKPRYMHTFEPIAGRRTVGAKSFQSKSGAWMRAVARSGIELVVTVRGQPHVVISPAVRRVGNTFIGSGQEQDASLSDTPMAIRGGAAPALDDAGLLELLARPVVLVQAQGAVPPPQTPEP